MDRNSSPFLFSSLQFASPISSFPNTPKHIQFPPRFLSSRLSPLSNFEHSLWLVVCHKPIIVDPSGARTYIRAR
ncbi:hypothetical protein BDV29DRAFT_183853 [Aspergillus leporis]|uniref:Uncharacterized protein n=1 Tax=Aspergillus leporis TaxID=41062 RepID=A0A5N5WK19_9EURO|nr:hypothetical protein BDV29DRAFT_183853 [Aspergillus leporis]